MPCRVFILGERGQLASALGRLYLARGHRVTSAGRLKLDIADTASVRSAVANFRPDIIVNAAAYTAVDEAEDCAEQAYSVNCKGAENAAVVARAVSAPLIHVSTDYVFDGSKATPYVETDNPNPIGIYGRSKLAAEQVVAAQAGDYVILRTGWMFSETGKNFVSTLLRLAREREGIQVVDDQWGTPTFALDLAEAIVGIGEKFLSANRRPSLCGIYHAAGADVINRFNFAQGIMMRSAAEGGPSCRVRPVGTAQYPTRVRRPLNSALDSSKLARVFGIRLPGCENSLGRCIDRLLKASVEHGQ